MNAYQQFALRYFLAAYPQDVPFEEIVGRVRATTFYDQSPEDPLQVWSNYQHFLSEWIAEQIESIAEDVEVYFIPRTAE